MIIFFLLCLAGNSHNKGQGDGVPTKRQRESQCLKQRPAGTGNTSGVSALLSAQEVSITGKTSEIFTKKPI